MSDGPSPDAGPLTRPDVRTYYARVRELLLAPTAAWERIRDERPTTQQLFLLWVLPFSAFFFIAPQVGSIAFPAMEEGARLAPSLARALYTIIVGAALMVAGVWALARIIDAFAKPFGGKPDPAQAMKLAAYSGTGLWVVSGVFGLAPPVALLGALGLVAIYTLWSGLPVLMQAPRDKATPYAASVIAAAAVLAVVLMALSQCAAMMGGPRPRPVMKAAAVAPVVAPAPVKAFDPAAPLDAEKMRRLLPDAIPGGWVRAGLTRNNGGALGFTGPTMEAVYEKTGRRLVVRVIDLGRAGAEAPIASLRATTPADAEVTHAETEGRYVFTQASQGVARWLTVVDNRIALAVEGSGGVTQAEIAEALAMIDMVRVSQIARGL